ncbi:MAG: type II toxin-antitoxin system Phd/YefM family antitoxin [Alphaproteobacteria bacterium]|nr:type II toxin-antitoxin system Phd/YefM family antitoxin [Alphaproteobacteria bacterium]MBV9152038.1 type II toxin-antitoxin system Phd/YefM family antitoxin [Alphaproteobacteria bacterium]MBV9586990.1 type II toxin-antitoxin system Phd/YefM family antitoxin [Alphaproteobacteria bacterium]MBV9968075.1 type II toxin-antitoxin system Phd/YefM family antitoxin [Alphaproteobacteria bacterium]
MEKVVSAAEANRRFSQLLRSVRDGDSYIVTAHGRPVAKIVPVPGSEAVRDKAWEALLARLRSQPIIDIGPWTREELYEDEV